MSSQARRADDTPWSVLLPALLGIFAVLFGLMAGYYWWLAHHLAWWTYSLLGAAGLFAGEIVKATAVVARERNR